MTLLMTGTVSSIATVAVLFRLYARLFDRGPRDT
jgi:hypothetical protein